MKDSMQFKQTMKTAQAHRGTWQYYEALEEIFNSRGTQQTNSLFREIQNLFCNFEHESAGTEGFTKKKLKMSPFFTNQSEKSITRIDVFCWTGMMNKELINANS